MSNTLESSDPQNKKSSKNELTMFQDTETNPFPEIQSSDNEDVSLLPNNPPGTELDESPNIFPLCEKQPCETDDKHPLAFQASDSAPNVNRQLMTESQNLPDNRCHTVQEIHVRNKLSELSVSHDSCPSLKHSLTHEQSGNEQILSQGTYLVSYKQHQSTSNVSQAACSIPRVGCENEFSPSRVTNIGSYFQYSGGTSGIQGLPLQSIQQSEGATNYIQSSHPLGFQQSEGATNYIRSSCPQGLQQSEGATNYIQSSHPQGFRQSEGATNYIRSSHTQKLQRSESDPNVIKFSSTIGPYIGALNSPMTLVPKESVLNQHLCSLNQQPVESRTRGIQGFPQVPQTFKVNSPIERHLSYSPYRRTQQHSKESPRKIQQAVTIYSPIPPPTPSLDNFLRMCCVMDQSRSPDHVQDRIYLAKHYDLTALQSPYANRSEFMNILVYGPVIWTSQLIKKFSRGLNFHFHSPFSLAYQGNVTRCGIVFSMNVWQVEDLNNSVQFLKSSCASAETTIIFVFNAIEKRLQSMIEFIRREVSQNTPIIFVVSKRGGRETMPRVTQTGFRLKAKHDLSGFLLCHVESIEEVDAVFLTAIDVSRLVTI